MVRTTRRVVKNDDDIDNRSRAGSKGRKSGTRDTRDTKDGSKGSRGSRASKGSRGSRRVRRRSKSRDGSRRSRDNSRERLKMLSRPVKGPNFRGSVTRASKSAVVSRPTKVTKVVKSKTDEKSQSAKTAKVVKSAKVVKTDKVVKSAKTVKTANSKDSKESEEDTVTTDTKSDDSESSAVIKTRFDNHSERLAEIDHQIDVLRRERKKVWRQMLKAHSSDLKKAQKNKKRTGHRGGFVTQKIPVGGNLANFLEVENGTEFTTGEMTKKFWEVMRSKNLVGVKNTEGKLDGRLLKVTKEIQEVFGVPDSAKHCKNFKDQNGFNFTTYKRYLTDALRNNNGEYGEDR